jgi:hypothetical protein
MVMFFASILFVVRYLLFAVPKQSIGSLKSDQT